MKVNDPGNSVSLKEHLLALLADQHEMAIHRETMVNLRFELAQRAIELDHIETLRRLDLLNHAHEKRAAWAAKCMRVKPRNITNGETR